MGRIAVNEYKPTVNWECQGQCKELYVALSDLYHVQNGPPLIQESKEYEAAMENARELLHYIRTELRKCK
jgi:hypothetical protein